LKPQEVFETRVQNACKELEIGLCQPSNQFAGIKNLSPRVARAVEERFMNDGWRVEVRFKVATRDSYGQQTEASAEIVVHIAREEFVDPRAATLQ
jgi:hypothetical protein